MNKENEVVLRVEGITCPGCAVDVESVLLDTDGVLTVSVSTTEDRIKINYDPNEIGEQQLVDRIRKLGLKITKQDHE